jgi:hypothetical protein
MSTITNRVAASPDQITGAHQIFRHLVQRMLHRYLAARGCRSGIEIQRDPGLQLLWRQLVSLYPVFQRQYCELFVEQVGPDETIPALSELQREPLQHYLRARAAITSDLAVNIKQLSHSWCREV